MIDKNITNPGYHKQFLLERFNAEEKKILFALARTWYLTNSGDEIRIAQSSYKYFLMKPTKTASEMFNIERELICVFSDYPNFEARSLDIFDAVSKRLPKMRVETVCGVLISRAGNVEEKVDQLLKSDPEYPVIVPFTYDELLTGGYVDNLVLNRFRKHFYSRDLFSFLSPLKKDTYFFGRGPLINEIVNRYKSGEHTSIFGLRKSGKTSIVFAIERRLITTGDKVLSLDCESPSLHLLRWYELLEKLVVQYRAVYNPSFALNTEGRYDEKNAADCFESDVLKIYRSRKAESTLFIFDEIERITPGTASSLHWKDGSDFIYFWQTLRGFYQRHNGVFAYMLVGTNPNCIESPVLAGHENPIYASMPSQYVPAFVVDQVAQMVTTLGNYMGLKFDALVCAKLTEDFGGHPFLIRQMCSLIHSKANPVRPATVDKTLYLQVKEEFKASAEDYLEMMIHVLEDWYPDEYDMLNFLAQGDKESFDEFSRDHARYTRHLVGYGLIQQGQSGFSFNLEAIADLLREKHRHERLNLTQEEKVQEISTRRVRIEKDLRSLVKSALRTLYGGKKATDLVIASIPETRRSAVTTLSLNQLLDRDASPLFFLELINIIKREWTAFEHILTLEKNKLIWMLEEINATGRPEAHAKHIAEDDFVQMRLHFKKLEVILDDFKN